jgi:hypothetical protein
VLCQQIAERGDIDAVPVFVEIDNTADIKAQIDTLSAELVHDRLEYEKGLRYIEHVRTQLVVPEAEETPVDVKSKPEPLSVSDAAASLSGQLEAAGLPKDPPCELPEILSEAAEIRQELAALQQPFSALNNREKQVPVVPWVALLSICLVAVAVTALSWWFDLYFLPVVPASLGVAVLSLAWAGWRHVVRKKGLADCSKEKGRLEQKKQISQKRQAELSERCEALGLPSSAIDLVRLQKLVTAHKQLLEQWWQREDSSAAKPGGEAVRQVIELDEAAEEVTAPVKENGSVSQKLQQLEASMNVFQTELTEKESRLKELQVQLREVAEKQSVSSDATDGSLHLRKRELEERIAVLRKAINLLAGAVDEFGRSHLASLNTEASKMFAKITNGRYPDLRLNEDMHPSVRIDSRRWMSVENFSRGTVDAIYLSLRVALAKVRDDGRSLPLMLDDPFVHLDQKRLAKTLNLVDLASSDGQLILFSHNLDLGKRAARERWHVVPLDDDSVAASPEEGGDHAGQLHLL